MQASYQRPEFITFTGADEHSSIDGMAALARRFPIEWGILLHPGRQGRDPRFPAAAALERLSRSGLRLSAHLCGEWSSSVMQGKPFDLPVDLRAFSRIQLNDSEPRLGPILKFQQATGLRCIAQCRDPEFPTADTIDWLHDLSGGRGIATTIWPPYPGRRVGYAGGIGPDNVAAVLSAIGADGPYWIDMETRVRRDERFDLELCERVCEGVYGG